MAGKNGGGWGGVDGGGGRLGGGRVHGDQYPEAIYLMRTDPLPLTWTHNSTSSATCLD